MTEARAISDGVDLKALIDAAKKATPGPWLYRPYEYDDWGFVRGGPLDEDGKLWPVAIARAGKHLTGDQYDSHRAAKTDPCGPNAAFIAIANPSTVAAMAEELMALREAVKPFAAGSIDISGTAVIGVTKDDLDKLKALTSLSEDTTHAK